ncbi:hypothetical protein BCR33DRAFT_785486 [Rhizoclosmatium globosum]|uniref:Uncharacterized protein n=1 Tax=Rhizoclosmatium globosum TaxID=329046 RepID=A0A1Y2CBD7_9FUNG|nr:hypothetical protein BCR33DRAFT_785486 [Rhizoclosmatium globosum]|eukprot:ORY43645.1 hypothetical protein BCR33DRAFT_785486 [Rhizoclosmatium globosum]
MATLLLDSVQEKKRFNVRNDAGDHLMGHKVHNVLGNLPYSIKQRRGGSNSQEDIKPSWGQSNKKGWIRDAHKFLPALKLLFKEHPNAPWYLLVDDDAYINLKGYEQQLNQFNSSDRTMQDS